MFDQLLNLIKQILGYVFRFIRPPRPPPELADPVYRLATTLNMLSTLDQDFSKHFNDIQDIRKEARDIIMFLAAAHFHVFGDEYGIPAEWVINLCTGRIRPSDFARLSRQEEINRAPRFLIMYSLFRPVHGIRLVGLLKDIDVAPLMKIAHVSRYFTFPMVFVMDIRMSWPTPVRLDPATWPRRTLQPRLPGPRIFYNIEKALKCEETSEGLECVAYIEDGTAYDITQVNYDSSPSTEVIYVRKTVRYIGGQKGRELDRRIFVAYVYNLLNLLSDEDIFKAYGILG